MHTSAGHDDVLLFLTVTGKKKKKEEERKKERCRKDRHPTLYANTQVLPEMLRHVLCAAALPSG